MRPTAPLLSVRDLTLTHVDAASPSPRNVTFDVHAGEVVLLLGPSGSGKSTLTLALNGLIPQSLPVELAGSVEVGGRSTLSTPVATLSTAVAMVFQDPDAQLVTGTVLDEVAFALENLRLPVEDILARSQQALEQVGLWHRRHWNPDRLSGGGRQRLAIACALAMGSPVIVLDEPTANLDSRGIDEVYEALSGLVATGERAVILVEHNLDAAMRFATRALVLDREGRLAFDGPVADVLRHHTDELVEMGVWLPAAMLAARRLKSRGIEIAPLPLTPEELRTALVDPAVLAHASALTPDSTGNTGPSAGAAGGAVAVRARSLTVRRRGQTILRDVTLDVPTGSLTAIVGANGAGKTTLIQALAGVVAPPRRAVLLGDLDPATASARQLAARIGFVFQNPEHQFITPSVREELAHGLTLGPRSGGGLSPAEIDHRVAEMLARFGLESKAHTHPFLLSGGEKRRLSVGTALITRPRVLALDEPTFGQDRARAAELLSLLESLRRSGTTILVVTHDLQLVADYATHTAVLADGRLRAFGPTADLFRDDEVFSDAGLRMPALYRALPPRLRALGTGALR